MRAIHFRLRTLLILTAACAVGLMLFRLHLEGYYRQGRALREVLRSNCITDDELVHLQGLNSLQKLDLAEPDVSYPSVATLRGQLPGCVIERHVLSGGKSAREMREDVWKWRWPDDE